MMTPISNLQSLQEAQVNSIHFHRGSMLNNAQVFPGNRLPWHWEPNSQQPTENTHKTNLQTH